MLTTKLVKTLCLFVATSCLALQAAQSSPRRPIQAPIDVLNITSPTNSAHVSSPLIIRGIARRNVPVQVHVVTHYSVKLNGRSLQERAETTVDTQRSLGTFRVNTDDHGKWNTAPVHLWLPENALNAHFEITASLEIGSHTYTSRVVKISPSGELERVPVSAIPGRGPISSTILNSFIVAPKITSPSDNARVNSPVTIRGTAGKNHQVQVHLRAIYTSGEQDLGTFKTKAYSTGNWRTTPIVLWLPKGATNAKFIVTAQQVVTGKICLIRTMTLLPPSNVTYRPVPLKLPLKKYTSSIITIQRVIPPEITTPKNNTHVVSNFAVKGKGVRGQTIKVTAKLSYTTARADGEGRRTTHQNLGTHKTTVKPDGTWVVSRFRVGDVDWDRVIANGIFVKLSATQIFTNNQEATAGEITVRPTENFENEGTDGVDGTVTVD